MWKSLRYMEDGIAASDFARDVVQGQENLCEFEVKLSTELFS